jgi:hypothetical protein
MGARPGSSLRDLPIGIRKLEVCGVAERLQEIPERGGESVQLSSCERSEQSFPGVDVVGQGLVDERTTVVGESDVHASAIGVAWRTCHEAASLKAVKALGDGTRGDHGRPHQLAGGQAMRWSTAAQGGEHIERRGVEPVRAERAAQLSADQPRGPRHAPDHRHRWHIQVGALRTPLLHHTVDVICHHLSLVKCLAVS